ncbi:alpha/beta fold hydrolase [Streptomyces telluris]|uniref:Alpha/beta hydrolase n=1 Tax=Streptomyces telluris TaxID=2720021 RepID=A0A9X2RNX3_9ACTN|nr:alpha/beta hydrolase [Streptomyces telluris]MCQ8772424.1 alpha/beta hydrolase [Streptomyces telluris]NJP79076.1 alpha/beta hydrolase [Streptomyces telluris]
MTTFVLVPGAWHGAWTFEPLARSLRREGHEAYPLTLTGVGSRKHLLNASVNLDTHIQDVVGHVEDEQLTDVILVGHSYGGMVITGAADRLPDTVAGLVYVDAVVPRDGDSSWSLVTDNEREWYLGGVGENGYTSAPLPFFDPRATPHPLASLMQAIKLDGGLERFRSKDYVYATGWPGSSPFTPVYEQLQRDPAWRVHAVDSGHNVMQGAPDELLKILLAAADHARA